MLDIERQNILKGCNIDGAEIVKNRICEIIEEDLEKMFGRCSRKIWKGDINKIW